MFPDYKLKAVFDYTKCRSSWYHLYQSTFEVSFDDNGAGILQSINSESTPVLKDVIIGTVAVASSIVKLLVGAFLAEPATEEEILQIETRERIITETYIIRTGKMACNDNSCSYTLPKPDVGDTDIKVPEIEILIKPDKSLKFKAEENNSLATIAKVEVGDTNIKVPEIKPNRPLKDYAEPKNRTSEERIFYREPILSNIQVIIRDNGFIKEAVK